MSKKSKPKKLSAYQLFYEEIPYMVSASNSKNKSKRVRRKSREEKNNIFDN